MTTDNKLTLLLDKQIPDYVQEFYPMFVIFVTKYFEWLEQSGNPQDVIQNIRLYSDIDTTVSSLTTRFLQTYVPDLPQNAAADSALLVKYFRDFYEAKGSERSFTFFFKAFFNDDVEVRRPREVLFKTSDGVWLTPQTLRVERLSGDPSALQATPIYGSSTAATAVIERVLKINENNLYDVLLQRNSVEGTFSSSETLYAYVWDYVKNVSSLVTMTNTAALQTEAGRFTDSRSQLSSDQILQDSLYYQNFSYVIRGRVNQDRWRRAILSQLHPAGTVMFNEFVVETQPPAVTSTFVRTLTLETTVSLATRQDFYIAPGYTFDRVADFYTGTSATTTASAISYDADFNYQGENVTWALQKSGDDQIYGYRNFIGTTSYTTSVSTSSSDPGDEEDAATITSQIRFTWFGTSLLTTAYYSSTATTYADAEVVQDYDGSSVTYLLSIDEGVGTQDEVELEDPLPDRDYFIDKASPLGLEETFDAFGSGLTMLFEWVPFTRVEALPEGPSFDKVGAGVAVTSSIYADRDTLDSSVLTTVLHTTSDIFYSSSEVLAAADYSNVTSTLLVITWVKDPTGNATSEVTNALSINITSDATIAVYYDDETQRNYRSLAFGETLLHRDLTYYNTSTTLTNTSGYISGSSTTDVSWTFVPFNRNRGQSYSRAVFRIESDGATQIGFDVAVSSSATFNALNGDHLNITIIGV